MMHLNYLKHYSEICSMKRFRQINGTANEHLKIWIVQQKYWQKHIGWSLTTSYPVLDSDVERLSPLQSWQGKSMLDDGEC